MSRFSPTVLPTSGRSLANALGQGVNAFLVTRAQKRQQDIEDEMRQRGESVQNAELGQQGIHITKPGELPPTFDVNVSGGPNPDDIVSRAITPLVAQTPRRPGQAPMDEGPTPGVSGPPLAAALSRHITSGPGYYIDRDEQNQHYQQQASVAQLQALAKALGEGSAQNILDPNARADKHAVAQSTVAKNNAVAQKPVPPVPGSPEWRQMEIDKAKIGAQYGYHPPVAEPLVPVADPNNPNGSGVYVPRPQAVGKSLPGKSGSGGQSGTAQAQQARMMAAVSEARLADERMRAFEDKLLSGETQIQPLQQAAGSLTTNLSDAHGAVGALTQAASEFGLNKSSPEYAQYLRDAATIGRAEQMMSPRGGNETMVRANALLSRAGTGAMSTTINASRMARQALFGPSGGIAQTLTPQQADKLETGVQRIKAGEHGSSSGNVDLRNDAKPPLSERVQQLRQQGLSKDAAKAQLLHEGYDLHGGE